jgi:hypothetical protein
MPLAPVQAQRTAELRLAYGFATALLLHWRSRTDTAIVGRFAGWAAPGLSQSLRREVAEAVELDLTEGSTQALVSTAMLEAATRWYVGLRLPRTRLELWSGPPLAIGDAIQPIRQARQLPHLTRHPMSRKAHRRRPQLVGRKRRGLVQNGD